MLHETLHHWNDWDREGEGDAPPTEDTDGTLSTRRISTFVRSQNTETYDYGRPGAAFAVSNITNRMNEVIAVEIQILNSKFVSNSQTVF